MGTSRVSVKSKRAKPMSRKPGVTKDSKRVYKGGGKLKK